MTKQTYGPRTYYVVCCIFLDDHLTLLSFESFFNWLALKPSVLKNMTITAIFLN